MSIKWRLHQMPYYRIQPRGSRLWRASACAWNGTQWYQRNAVSAKYEWLAEKGWVGPPTKNWLDIREKEKSWSLCLLSGLRVWIGHNWTSLDDKSLTHTHTHAPEWYLTSMCMCLCNIMNACTTWENWYRVFENLLILNKTWSPIFPSVMFQADL